MPPPGRALVTNVPVVMSTTPVVAGPFNYPNGDRAFNMTTRWVTNVGTHIRVWIEGRVGNTGQWLGICGFTATGEPYIDEDTGELTDENLLLVAIPTNSPLAGQNNRDVRVTFTTLEGPPPTLAVSVATA